MSPHPHRDPLDLLNNEALEGWRGALVRLGKRRTVLAVSAASVLLSVCITALINYATNNGDQLWTDVAVATIVPLLVAPLVSQALVGLLIEVEAARQALHHLAVRDGLTNLYNRRFFMGRLQAEVSRAQREGSALALLMVDVDHFKAINDQRGHAAGDAVLERLASVLIGGLRPYDVSARYGGEEFVAMLPGATLAEAELTAERLRRSIESLRMPGFGVASVPDVTASLGVSSLGLAPDDAASLLRRADEGLYAAKAAGRNRCVSVRPGGCPAPAPSVPRSCAAAPSA